MPQESRSKLLGAGRVDPRPDWRMPPHQHTYFELIVPIAGRMSVRLAGREISAGAGTVLLYPRGVAHEERTDRQHPVATRFLSFQWDRSNEALPLEAEDHEGRIREAVEWLYRDRDLVTTPAVTRQREATLEMILSVYLVCAARRPEEDDLVRRVRRHVREHLAEGLLLEDLAEVGGMSRFHFLRVYERLTGRSPMADVRRMRLEHARELLLTTSLPLKQIAPLCGLGSEYALSRAFSQHFNHPPSNLRRRGKEGGGFATSYER